MWKTAQSIDTKQIVSIPWTFLGFVSIHWRKYRYIEHFLGSGIDTMKNVSIQFEMYRYNLKCIDTNGSVSIPCIDTIQTEATAKNCIDTQTPCIDTIMQKCKFFIPWPPETPYLSPGWPTPMPLVPKKFFAGRTAAGDRRPLCYCSFLDQVLQCWNLPRTKYSVYSCPSLTVAEYQE